MSIKSDRWIRRMASEYGMIEPFASEQVRSLEGHKIISYGTSSYGYDVRCANEFKVFTNINSTIVDPKAFDEKSFVDLTADVCVIPPNSFALARTVEYLRIPRNVLVACLGKSTYARCFRGDTRVALADGAAPTLEHMARRHESGERFRGYAMGRDGRIMTARLEAPRYIGRDALLDIELDNGERIHATADHQFMRRNGRMVQAHRLRPGDALMPLYRALVQGCERVYQPLEGMMRATPRFADECNMTRAMREQAPATHRHRAERPAVLVRSSPDEHLAALGGSDHVGRVTPLARVIPIRSGLRGERHVIGASRGRFHYRNHKIVAIRELPGEHDVFCLSVPQAGNFALEAGVFVHNCGIIVNVTPLEPEWEGHVTLEFSNTTPLPAKIYAHEGVAQMLFFESDEVCSTSYKDRGGKYQGQRGVTLPKA